MKKKSIFVLSLLALLWGFPFESVMAGELFSQSSFPGFNTNVIRPTSSYFFNSSYGNSRLMNDLPGKDFWNLSSQGSFHFELGYQARINPTTNQDHWLPNNYRRLMSYGIGLGISQYGSKAVANDFQVTKRGFDLDVVDNPEVVDREISYHSLSEITNITFLHIPVFLEIGNTNLDQLGLFFRVGLNLATPIIQSFEGGGSYSVRGYYENHDVWLENITELGFNTNKELYQNEDKYKLNSLHLNGSLAAGASYPISGKYGWIINLSAMYHFGLSDIIAVEIKDNVMPGEEVKMSFNNNSPTRSNWFGFQIGIQYILGFY